MATSGHHWLESVKQSQKLVNHFYVAPDNLSKYRNVVKSATDQWRAAIRLSCVCRRRISNLSYSINSCKFVRINYSGSPFTIKRCRYHVLSGSTCVQQAVTCPALLWVCLDVAFHTYSLFLSIFLATQYSTKLFYGIFRAQFPLSH